MYSSSMSFGAEGEPTPEQLAQLEILRAQMAGPPENMVGVAWPFTAVVGSNGEAAVLVHGGEVFPTGVSFRMTAVLRRSSRGGADPMGFLPHPGRNGARAAGALRFGLRYADGRAVDLMDQMPGLRPVPARDPAQPRLLPLGGHGGDRTWAQELFLRPLPPDGPLELFCAWPDFEIGESSTTVDLTGVTAAAAAAVELWPVEPEPVWQPPAPPRLGNAGPGFFRPILDDDTP